MKSLEEFKEIWLVDFEFGGGAGNLPDPRCMVAVEVRSGKILKLWRDDLERLAKAPFDTSEKSLFIAYYSTAEFACFHFFGWKLPQHVLDLFAEFRNYTNGKTLDCSRGLLGALSYFGLPAISSEFKDGMRDLAIRGGPFSEEEKKSLLEYCREDVVALERLLPCLIHKVSLEHALLRGDFMKAASVIEFIGVPIDIDLFNTLENSWSEIQDELIREIDKDFHVFEGRTFKVERWARWLELKKIPWPLKDSGVLDLEDTTFSDMCKIYPAIAPMRELRGSLSKMRLSDLSVGDDGRNRCMLSPFAAKTGRNQPSTSKFIFGPSTWIRGLVSPKPGMALAYLDWAQQEFGIAASLSGDENMQAAYLSGDPYLSFAIKAGAAPQSATRASHSEIRDLFKQCILGMQYQMGAQSLAIKINRSVAHAVELIRLHHKIFAGFWSWSEGILNYASLNSSLSSVFGWNIYFEPGFKERTARNFPMQANGAEILRLACIMGINARIRICAPVHDAVLIEAPTERIYEDVKKMQDIMAEASQIVLGGFRLTSDAKIIHFGDRFMDKRGIKMWQTVWNIINKGQPNPTLELGI